MSPGLPDIAFGPFLGAARLSRISLAAKRPSARSKDAVAANWESTMDRTLFTNVTILDCTGAAPFAGEVLVEGNRIKQLGKGGKALPKQGARVVDGGGAT